MRSEKHKQSFKIRIFQPSVPEYRARLYEGLGKRYAGRIELWASPVARAGVKSVPLENIPYDYSHKLKRAGNFYWQCGLSLNGLSRGDVLVVCGEIKGVSNVMFALLAKLKGIKVIWWGHHWSSTSKLWKVLIRLQVVKLLSDAYLCYTQAGVDFLRQHGFQNRLVFFTGNTIDQDPIKKAVALWDRTSLEQFQNSQGICGSNLILVCGVLRAKMKLDVLIRALADQRLISKKVLVAIIGDGPEKNGIIRLSEDLCVSDKLKWVGATRSQEVMAPWFLSAKAYVYPGAIGLGILHSFSYGLPVITHGNLEHQMPEFEAMENGKTGFTFRENDVNDLVCKIVAICSDEKRRMCMSKYVRDKALRHYSINSMIDNFCNAIEKTVK